MSNLESIDCNFYSKLILNVILELLENEEIETNINEILIWPRGGMVDTKDLKSLPIGSASSSLAEGTIRR